MSLSGIFPPTRAQDEAARGKDLAELDKGLGDLARCIQMITDAMGPKPDLFGGQSASVGCSRLCPRDFDKKVFDALPGFQALVNVCFSIDAAFRISVGHTTNPDAGNRAEPKELEKATVIMSVHPAKNFGDSAIVIYGDQFLCTMPQVIPADVYAKIPVYRPLKLKTPAQMV
jgi:hypothetical protein